MSTGLQFSEEEIKEKLKELGYNDIPPEKLKEFSRGMIKRVFSKFTCGNITNAVNCLYSL